MLDDVTIKELIPVVGVRLKFQKAFLQFLVSNEKVASNENDDIEGEVGSTIVSKKNMSSSRSNPFFTLDEDTVRDNSKIFGLKNPNANLTQWQNAVNDCAFELAKSDSNLLYNRGLLKTKAEEKARAIYIFKKKTGSRSTKIPCASEPKRRKLSKEDRAHEIYSVSTEIEMVVKHINIKQQMISKATLVKDFQLCDKEQKELRELVQKKVKLEKMLKKLQKKEAKGRWYEKSKYNNASNSMSCSLDTNAVKKQSLPPKSAANTRDIRTLFKLKPSSISASNCTNDVETNGRSDEVELKGTGAKMNGSEDEECEITDVTEVVDTEASVER